MMTVPYAHNPDTPIFRLMHRKIPVEISNAAVEYLFNRRRYSPSTGDRAHDETVAGYFVPRNLNAIQLARLRKASFEVEFKRPRDTLQIYNDIKEHLLSWNRVINESLQDIEVPIDDLNDLDDLAEGIFSIARQFMREDELKKIADRKSRNRFLSQRRLSTGPEEKEADIKLPTEHKSLSDLLEVSVERRRRRKDMYNGN